MKKPADKKSSVGFFNQRGTKENIRWPRFIRWDFFAFWVSAYRVVPVIQKKPSSTERREPQNKE
jgi:hypothetical protein